MHPTREVVVWVDVEGDRVLLNTSEGRIWWKSVQRDPRVALTVPNDDDPYEFVSMRGRVVETTREGADEHIDKLARKYLGQETYPDRQPGEIRSKLVIEPDRVRVHGA